MESTKLFIGLRCVIASLIVRTFSFKNDDLSICKHSSNTPCASIIDQFWRKMCQKKCEDVGYQLLPEFFQKYFVKHESKSKFVELDNHKASEF